MNDTCYMKSGIIWDGGIAPSIFNLTLLDCKREAYVPVFSGFAAALGSLFAESH